MIYTIKKANLISEQLRKFTSGYSHHLAGQHANIDFWLQEVNDAVKTIDEYNHRFIQLRDKQKEWVEEHGTIVYDYCPMCRGKCEFADGRPRPPKRTPHSELKILRRELKDNAYHFLLRCYKTGLLDLSGFKSKCVIIDCSIDPMDVEEN